MAALKFTFDDSTFIKNVQEVSDRLHQQMAETIKEMTKTFTNVAAEYTPPFKKGSMREKRVAKQFIMRKIVDLSTGSYVNDSGAYELDKTDKIQLYGKKLRYKVIFDKKGLARRKSDQSIYTKSLSAAKELARVHNRGLARAMWGKNIGTIGKAFGAAISDALKAMGSSSSDFNRITFREDENIVEVEIDNGANSVRSGVMQSAADKAWDATKKRWDYILKALVNGDKEL